MNFWACKPKEEPVKAVCGNGAIEPGETCDTSELNGSTCITEGFGGGVLTCNDTCDALVTAACDPCGNNTIDGNEACDDTELNGATCTGLGYDGGTLSCADGCVFNTANCDLNGDTCADPLVIPEQMGISTINGSTAIAGSDILLSCGNDATGPDIVYALNLSAAAGVEIVVSDYDSVVEFRSGDCAGGTVEICNDEDPQDPDAGWGVGSRVRIDYLAAGAYYLIVDSWGDGGDFTMTVELADGGFPRCGDDTIQPDLNEICDGGALNSKTCADFGFDGGNLGCNSSCRAFDVSACTTTEVCGNSAVAGPEVCDATNLNSATCESLGYGAGTLTCAGDCLSFDVSGCAFLPACGNATADIHELCDGTSWDTTTGAAPTCADVGLGAGDLACNADCSVDASNCETTDLCTAWDFYNDGYCDPCDLMGGVADVECNTLCGADGYCADYYDTITGVRTCRHAGLHDPDCGPCGDGLRQPDEECDTTDFGGIGCADIEGFTDGVLGCRGDCVLDITSCNP